MERVTSSGADGATSPVRGEGLNVGDKAAQGEDSAEEEAGGHLIRHG